MSKKIGFKIICVLLLSISSLHAYETFEDKITYAKYKKKIYIKDGLYQYRICHVLTHHLSIKTKNETYKTTTDEDSCDKYMFENESAFKTYSLEKIEELIQDSEEKP